MHRLAGALLFWLAAAFAFAQPLDVLVLLDESGSMYGNDRPEGAPGRVVAQDPEFLRYTAIQCLARKLRPGDQLAVVPFGSHPMGEYRIGFRDPFASVDWSRLAERGKVGKKQSSGTDYVSAFQQAAEVFGASSSERARITILLSDGDPASNVLANVYEEAGRFIEKTGSRLYTIGLGSNFRTDVLTQLAQTGRGKAFQASNPSQLPFQFAEVLRVGGNREVRTPQQQGTFVVGPLAAELRAISVTPGETPTFALRSPSGIRIAPALDPAAYPDGQPSRVCWLRVPNPEPGVWTVEGDPASLDIAYESALKIQIVKPDEGETLSNEGSVAVRVDVEGSTPTDELQGTLTVRWSDGSTKSLPVNFRGSSGQSVLDLDGAPPGRADLTAEIERRFLGERERGVPGTRQVLVVAAPPGVPAARAVILGEAEQTVWAGRTAKLTVRVEANREAVGSTLVIEAGKGWTAPPVRIESPGSKLYPIELRGPYEGKRGLFRTTLNLDKQDPALELTSDPFALAVQGKTWRDWFFAFSQWVLIPFFLTVALLAAIAGIGIWGYRRKKRAKKVTLDSIRIQRNGEEVAHNQYRKGRGASERSLGTVRQAAGAGEATEGKSDPPEYDYLLALEGPEVVWFTAKAKKVQDNAIVPIVFSEGALAEQIRVLPGELGTLKLPQTELQVTTEGDPHLKRDLGRGTTLLCILTPVAILCLGLALYRGVAEADAKSRVPEAPLSQGNSLQPN